MRLCSKCGCSLVQNEKIYSCPRGHGYWAEHQGIKDKPVQRFNGNLAKPFEAGSMEFKGGSKSGKKRKKKPRVEILTNIFERP